MGRKYNSANRRKAAEKTRQGILRAALKLHWEGITEYEPLAREAGCSVATVRKHFPTRESLFQNCTRTFAESLTLPDLDAIGEITDRQRRIEAAVSELCRIHEAMFGYAWLGAQQRQHSPTLDGEMAAYEGLADAVAALVASEDASKSALIRGLLDFPPSRALRLSGGLPPPQASEQLIATVKTLNSAGGKPPAH